MWSLPHAFFGVVMALAVADFGYGFTAGFGATLAIAFLWEWFERRAGIREPFWNSVTDCGLPLLLYALTSGLAESLSARLGNVRALLIASLLVYLIINALAWEARLNGERDYQC